MAERVFRKFQFVSAWLDTIGHGGNGAKKTMRIAVLLYSHGKLGGTFHVPPQGVLPRQAAMGLGASFGGLRI